MKKLIEIPRQKLYDGIGTETDKQRFKVMIGKEEVKFKLADFDQNDLYKLRLEVNGEAFNSLLQTEKFQKPEDNLFENYLTPERLNVYFLVRENYILILSFGEFQPARDMIFLESVWKK